MCLVTNNRQERIDDVGIAFKYKIDGKLFFRRYIKHSKQFKILECQFADDAAILTTTQSGAERAISEFATVSSDFGLTVSFQKPSYK